MKKITLLLLMLLSGTGVFAQGMFALFNRSEDFFKLLEEGKFTDAQNYFDPTLKDKVKIEELQKLWSDLRTNLGEFELADPVRSKTEGEFFTVTVEAKFARATQDFLLAYNKEEKMVGFFLQPKSNAAVYLNPAYANPALYTEKTISVNTPGHELAAILTMPAEGTNFPIVVLVHGSGPSDMDETIGPNKPFKDLAAGLAAKGIASVRYVKRTMVYAGEFSGVFTVKEETLDDAAAALKIALQTPGVDKKQVYIFGHSLGGMLAPRIAGLVPETKGIILAEAPARKMVDILIEQNQYLYDHSKDTTAQAKAQLDFALKALEQGRINQLGQLKADSVVLGLPASYWVDLNQYNQVEAAQKLNKRILVIQGEQDFQVSVKDFEIWKAALEKKKNVTLKLYPDLNHLLSSQVEKGDLRQYESPSSVSETLINDIVAWIKGG
ncbi:alpha/beta fold hydrolase [Pedobacter antarcticus]|uniref:alpha/beta fold hydrolase n=1 Tax=Pedobacter antarcticus TaxID=34086 RepID=UPI00292E7CAF|nr:alpha/beta fold hydrolase [Pedobacter antarcticus]